MRLRESTAKMLIANIQQNFNHKIPYKNKKNYSYQNILYDNIQNMANFISDKKTKFEFNIPKLRTNEIDYLAIKERILKKSLKEERKDVCWEDTY